MATAVYVVVDDDGERRLQHEGRDLPSHVCEESELLHRHCMEMSAGQWTVVPVCSDDFKAWINFATAGDVPTSGNTNASLQHLAVVFKVHRLLFPMALGALGMTHQVAFHDTEILLRHEYICVTQFRSDPPKRGVGGMCEAFTNGICGSAVTEVAVEHN